MNELTTLIEQLVTPIVVKAVKLGLEELSASNSGRSKELPEVIDVTKAMELSGYAKNTIYQMHGRGEIPGAFKNGGKLLFDTQVFKEWINRRKVIG